MSRCGQKCNLKYGIMVSIFPQKVVNCWSLHYVFCQKPRVDLFRRFSFECLIESIFAVDLQISVYYSEVEQAQTFFFYNLLSNHS